MVGMVGKVETEGMVGMVEMRMVFTFYIGCQETQNQII